MLFVHPSARGVGVGRRLIGYATERLCATTVDVKEQNQQAIGFYLEMGFRVRERSELDSLSKPFPLLHMQLTRTVKNDPHGATSCRRRPAFWLSNLEKAIKKRA